MSHYHSLLWNKYGFFNSINNLIEVIDLPKTTFPIELVQLFPTLSDTSETTNSSE